jgi:hypothetical protein
MTSPGPDKSNIALVVVTELATWQCQRLREMYDWVVSRSERLGLPVSHLGYTGSQKYATFSRARRRFEGNDWDALTHLSLLHIKPERKESTFEFHWTAGAWFETMDWSGAEKWLERKWRAAWAIDPTDARIPEEQILPHLLEFAKLTVGEYGYLFYMRRGRGPSSYASGSRVGGDGRDDDSGGNVEGWRNQLHHFRRPLLRDVYPYNFVGRPYLDLPVEGTTLEGWIRADAGRGTLDSLNEKVSVWRPSADSIPAIREALFRAGALYYWRFFTNPTDADHVQGPRRLAEIEPVPRLFKADSYRGRDAMITD